MLKIIKRVPDPSKKAMKVWANSSISQYIKLSERQTPDWKEQDKINKNKNIKQHFLTIQLENNDEQDWSQNSTPLAKLQKVVPFPTVFIEK